jgi:hypothetical protein
MVHTDLGGVCIEGGDNKINKGWGCESSGRVLVWQARGPELNPSTTNK